MSVTCCLIAYVCNKLQINKWHSATTHQISGKKKERFLPTIPIFATGEPGTYRCFLASGSTNLSGTGISMSGNVMDPDSIRSTKNGVFR